LSIIALPLSYHDLFLIQMHNMVSFFSIIAINKKPVYIIMIKMAFTKCLLFTKEMYFFLVLRLILIEDT